MQKPITEKTESASVTVSITPRRGYAYVVLAAVCWAAGGSTSKFLFNNGITPFQMVQLRLTIATAILALWLLCRHRNLLKIDGKDVFYFLLLGTLGMAAVNITYLFAISRLNVAVAILLEYLASIFIALYAVLFMRDRLTGLTKLAIIFAVSGCYLVVGAYNINILNMNLAGIISGLLAALAFAWWSLHGEYGMRRYNPWTVLFFAMLVAAVEWNLLHPPLESLLHAYTLKIWFWIIFIAVVGTILPFGLYYEGINLIRSTRASITSTLEPIMAGVFAFFFLNEVMEPLQLLGGGLVIAAVITLQVKREHDQKAPNVIRAQATKDCPPV
jgi:drug/metabolite transporter (DMT)-like permease